MKILLAGGGSGGPVAPLLAVASYIKQHHEKAEFLLVGTAAGPERAMAKAANIPFAAIPAGKWRRYFSLENFMAPFLVLAGFFKARALLKKFRPDCVLAAGSFVQVPVVWAAKFSGIPVAIHQQDVLPGLANRLSQYAASKITVTFADSLTDFSSGLGLFYIKNKSKIVLTGNPFRQELKHANRQEALEYFGLASDLPVLLVLGGGTGAKFINELIASALPELRKTVQIIHSTGPGKGQARAEAGYKSYEFISRMDLAYSAADIVLSRAGLSTITELSNLVKLSIIIPMPHTHQELNAYYLYEHKAALILDQDGITPPAFAKMVRRLLFEHELQQKLKEHMSALMPKNAAEKISDIVVKLIERPQ